MSLLSLHSFNAVKPPYMEPGVTLLLSFLALQDQKILSCLEHGISLSTLPDIGNTYLRAQWNWRKFAIYSHLMTLSSDLSAPELIFKLHRNQDGHGLIQPTSTPITLTFPWHKA